MRTKFLPGPQDLVVVDEHLLLDDNKYIADALCEFRATKVAKEGYSSKLLFKKRMFRETDETITEPQFVSLSYVQVRLASQSVAEFPGPNTDCPRGRLVAPSMIQRNLKPSLVVRGVNNVFGAPLNQNS